MMTYHQLRTFLIVARTGNLTRAARELNATQPTVSLQIRALAQFLGTALTERDGARFRLTPAGEQLSRYAEEVLGGLRVLQQDIATLKGRLAGPLAVGAPFVMSRHILPSVFSRFLQQFPDVDLQVHVEFPEQLFAGLLANTLDVACYINVRTPGGLTIERVGEDPLIVIASPQHPLAGHRRVSAQQLSDQPFVAAGSALFRDMVEGKLRDAGVRLRVAAEARHQEASKKLVERNIGYSMVTISSATDELRSGRLVPLAFAGPPMSAEFVVAFRSRPVVPPLVKAFIGFVRTELSSRCHSISTKPKRQTRHKRVRREA